MRRGWLAFFLLLPSLTVNARSANELCLSDARGLKVTEARLFDGVGSYRAPRVSDHPEAQRYFEQGLVFGWGFNFAEAARSFRAATVRDPDCAMCRWGIAWAVGPSINHDMDAADMPIARDAIVQARVYAADARARELVEAMALRYAAGATHVDDAAARRYAEAMVALAGRRSDDADIAVLAAEALMTAHAYDWWRADGTAQRWTPRIAELLDRALSLAPDHPGAHHYRIHLYDESRTPAAALGSAQRLPAITPGVGHLVHMPSHVYLRLGRYHEAVLANQRAVSADERYATATITDRAYAAGYALHNQHFLWTSALWSGESQLALDTATSMAATVASWPDLQIDAGTRQHLMAAPWFTLVRFGRWNDILLATMDSKAGPYLRGVTAYARGTAFAHQGMRARAEQELTALRAARRQASAQKLEIKQTNRAGDLLAVAEALLRSDVAAARGSRAEAVRHARVAVAREDRLASDEPPAWQIPARHRLGQALLQADQARAALAVFEADLERHPANAVALAGRAESERRLGNAAGADALFVHARTAWSHADVPLPVP
jgi:tetratricopeptide (TPR) repeat protein